MKTKIKPCSSFHRSPPVSAFVRACPSIACLPRGRHNKRKKHSKLRNPLTKEILCKGSGSPVPLAQIPDPSSAFAPTTFMLHLDRQHPYPSVNGGIFPNT